MRGRYIKSKTMYVSIPEPAYGQLKKLAEATGRTAPGYVRHLITQEFLRLGLPLYITVHRSKNRTDT